MALKLLPRTEDGENELRMYRYLQGKTSGHHVAPMLDEFKIPHHRWNEGDPYKVEYSVIALPALGPDIRYYCEWSERVMSVDEQKSCIRSTVQGVAQLHELGVVHAG